MNKVRLNEAQQTLEAVNLSGCIFIYLDDKPSVRLSFSQKLKVYFDIVDNSQTFTSGCHLRALAAFDHNQTTDTSYEESCACAEDSIILSEVGQDRFFANSDNDTSIARLTHEDSSLSIPHLGAASDRVGLKEDFYSLEGGSHQLLIQCDTSSDDKQANLFDEKNLTKQEGANSNPLSQDNEKCSSKEQFSYYKSSKAERRDVKFSKSKIAPSQLRLKCSHCSITFSSKARLAAHNRMPGCIKQCEKCGENFLCFADLFIHQYRKYDPDFMAQNYPLLSILKSDDCKSTQCPFCTIKFQSASSLLKHLQVKHFSDATYACCMCDRAFKTFSLLKSHRIKCSSKKQRKKNISKFASTTKSEDDSLLESGSVKICNSSYNSLAEGLMDIDGKNNLMQSRSNTELQEKIQNSENEMQKVNLLKFQQNSCSSDYTLSAVEPEVPKLANLQSGHTCSYCTKTFPSSAEKEAHNRLSKCVRQCEQCKNEFPCEADLFVHKYKYHDRQHLVEQFPSLAIGEGNQLDELQCPICNSYLPATVMQHHLQAKHFSDESYSCCVCKSYFKTSSCLKFHLDKHFPKRKRESTADDRGSLEVQKSKKKTKFIPSDLEMSYHSMEDCAETNKPVSSIFHLRKIKKKQNPCDNGHDLPNNGEINEPNLLGASVQKSDLETKNCSCKHCGKTFSNQLARNNHKKVPPLKIKCPKCPCILDSQASLIIHNFQVHERQFHEEMVKGSFSGTKKSSGDIDKSSLHRCPLCWKSVIRLRKHVALCHTGEMLYQCCVCGKKFSSSATLKRHCDDHLKERKGKFQCSKCPMVTNNHSDFFKHAATHRSQCVFCKTEFGHSHLLWSHYLSQHEDELFTCNTCGKKIATKEQLETHMKYHRFTHVQPCPKCGIMIKGSLKKHLKRKHHGELDETDNKTVIPITGAEENVDGHTSSFNSNNYQCHNCPESFSNNQSLTQHRKSHNRKNIPCPNCNKTFSTKSILTKHIDRVHLKISRHICDICGKKATSSYNLKVHKRIHSTTKLFICELCDQGFNYKASLQGHMRSKHSGHQFEAMKNTSA